MIILDGKYNTAKVFTDNVEQTAVGQIVELCNQEFTKGSKIRIMPDTHAGAGCTIGTTMTIGNKIVPNLVGVDIGCGMLSVNFGKKQLNFSELDWFIHNRIPHGMAKNKELFASFREIEDLICLKDLVKTSRDFNLAIGSLGGGNHFIEINENNAGEYVLVIHSGSRNLGLQVAKHYQDKAFENLNGIDEKFFEEKDAVIKNLKKQGKQNQIQNSLDGLRKKYQKTSSVPKDLCYIEGKVMQDYLHDLKIAQKYARINRGTMALRIAESVGLDYYDLDTLETIHNYIDLDNMILRKGAVSARKGEKLIIPINMRDGSLLCVGKGNEDWNFSAPHGAGRLMSRSAAKESLQLDEFKDAMNGIYSTSVSQSTLDESPMAYKPMEEIMNNIKDTVDVIDIIKPVYNFKSGS